MFSAPDNGQPIPLFKFDFVLQVNACWSRNFNLAIYPVHFKSV